MPDWMSLITDPSKKWEFVGENLIIPKREDRVRILRGPLSGEEHVVVGVWGPAWSVRQKVYVVLPGDRLVWLWPWDVEVLGS
jgi:hypothetical protein